MIVGLDNDLVINNSKGLKRPINNIKRRSEFLSELILIDHVIEIKGDFKHGDPKAYLIHENLLKKIAPTYMFSSIACDDYIKQKKAIAKKLGVKFIIDRSKKVTNIQRY